MAFPLLTKVTPGAGPLFAVPERAALAIATGTTLALAGGLLRREPSLGRATWSSWPRHAARGRLAVPYPLWLRLPLAVALVAWGARTNRRWVVPAAALLALPRLYFQSPALLLAVLPALRGGWASAERWGRRERRPT